MLQNFTYYAQFMFYLLSIMLYKFNILFLLSNLNYKLMSISSHSSSSTVQHTINNSSIYVYNINTLNSFLLHLQPKSHNPVKSVLFIQFLSIVLAIFAHDARSTYTHCFFFHIMLKIMLV